ncbi:unnamed protein product [Diatraea saccharalis]|uniref:Guanylyl cyclase n=1 Tax=Diatraea saccharalis TaxID=40085 RepID=A0A9N9R6E1_9NEOP|nr:unnamed protein product [Diatraea saccharalis]
MTSEDGKDEYSQNLVLHKLVHYQQRFSWDCGVACVMMLLEQEQRLYFLQNFSAICQEEGFNQSTWTIDLCYLLKRFGIEHTMYTTMLGVNEDYKKHSYYDRISDLVSGHFFLELITRHHTRTKI